MARGTKTRLAFDILSLHPAWSPDGDRIAYAVQPTRGRLYINSSNGQGTAQRLTSPQQLAYAPAWSPDGTYLIYHGLMEGFVGPSRPLNRDLLYLRVPTGPIDISKISFTPFLETAAFQEMMPQFSPDGRYVAYASNESGRFEVYIRSFPNGLDKWPVSINGGHYPKWNPAGNELVFVSGISIGSRNLNTLMAVSVEMKEGLEIGILQKLFSAGQVGADFLAGEGGVNTLYEPSSDGQRFVGVQNMDDGERIPTITVVENWIKEFESP